MNEKRKQELVDRIEAVFARASGLKTKGEHQQRRKCSECGKSYLGQENSSTCSDKCRKRKSRG